MSAEAEEEEAACLVAAMTENQRRGVERWRPWSCVDGVRRSRQLRVARWSLLSRLGKRGPGLGTSRVPRFVNPYTETDIMHCVR